MRNNNLEQFVKLRRELALEKESLTRRLAQINAALGETAEASASPPAPTKSAPATPAPKAGRKPLGGGSSLRELVLQVLQGGPKTKEEVLAAVQQLGYRFQTRDPLNSLGVILYGRNPKFIRVEGRFALPGGAAGSVAKGSTAARGKQGMSAASRKKIAEAARKRWAAAKAAGKSRL